MHVKEGLRKVENKKIDSADFAICTANIEKARKQVLEKNQ